MKYWEGNLSTIFFSIAVLFTYSASLGFLAALMIHFELKNIMKIDINQKKNMGRINKNVITKGILILSILSFARFLATQKL